MTVSKKGFPAHAFCVFTFYFCLAGCSIPNLEPQSCIDARTPVREFYSFHFGNEMLLSPESLKARDRFLTPGYVERLLASDMGVDPFTTGTSDLPKAFRVGKCTEIAPDRVQFQVLLFWRDDVRSEQREVKADMTRANGTWLLDNVTR